MFGVFRQKDITLGIDKVICTGSIEALSLTQDLFLALLGDIDIVVLAPLLSLQVVGITVVVPSISTALVDEEGVEKVRGLVDVAIGLFDLLVQLSHLIAVCPQASLQSLLVFAQDCY